jgi:hypothetical protein
MKILVSLLSFVVTVTCFAMAAPKPAIVQRPQDWTVDVKYEPLQQIMLRTDERGKPMRFWYLILTVTNNTGDDVEFYPQCELMTDTFEIIPAGRDVPPGVFEYIKTRHRSLYPFLEQLDTSGMRILQGSDNTRDIAIIWPDFDLRAKEISLFIEGLSNETVAVDYPVAVADSGMPEKVFLRKTLELDYSFSGDPAFRAEPKMTFEGSSWIMR